MIVFDASAAVKWFLKEPFSDEARAPVEEGALRIAPEHILAEVGQVLLRTVRAGSIALDHAREALTLLRGSVQLVPLRDLADSGIEIAMQVGCTHYEPLYVASAERFGATLVTADAKLVTQLRSAGRPEIARSLGA